MKLIKNFPFIKLNKGIASKARDGYIWYNFYYSNGMNIYDKIKQPAMIFTALSAVVYFEWIPRWILGFFVPLWFTAWPYVGWIYFKILKIPQRSAVISGSKISPWERRNRELFLEILRELKKK